MAGRNYRCQCGQPVFFRNSRCLACGTPLGYDCERALLLPLMPAVSPDNPNDATQAEEAQGIMLWQPWQPQPVALAASGPDASDQPEHRLKSRAFSPGRRRSVGSTDERRNSIGVAVASLSCPNRRVRPPWTR